MAKFKKDNLTKTIKLYGDPIKGVKEGNSKALLDLAVKITAQAKDNAPVDLGQLKNSIMFNVEGKEGGFNDSGGEQASQKLEGKASEGEGYIGSNIDYSVYQEFGTRKQYPQPFLRPAVATVQGVALNDVKKAIDKAVDNSLKSGASPKFEKEFKFK